MSDKVTIKFKKLHPDAKMPERAHEGDAGWDLSLILRKHHIPL